MPGPKGPSRSTVAGTTPNPAEHDEDQDYYIDRNDLELLSDNGADPELLALLEKGIGDDDSMEIAWE